MFHALAAIHTTEALTGSRYVGSSWEGYVIQQLIACLAPDTQPYYYRTADGSELDWYWCGGGQPVVGLEIKYTNAPILSRGNYIASRDLGTLPLLVVTPSAQDFRPDTQTQVCSVASLWQHLLPYNVLIEPLTNGTTGSS